MRHVFAVFRFGLRLLRSKRLWGLTRVASFLAVVNIIITIALLAHAGTQAEGMMTQLGDRVVTELGPIVAEPQAVKINGQSMFVASRTTPLSVGEAMDLVEDNCRESAPNWLGPAGNSPKALERLPAPMRDLAALGIPRSDRRDPSAKHAEIACIAHHDAQSGFAGAWERAKRFVETGDLGQIGGARYFRAEAQPDGSTHVLGVWTEGAFNLYEMFPERGDAVGSDSPVAPRPPEATRSFTAELTGTPYALRTYASKQSKAQLFAFYEREMTARGFRLQPISLDDEKMVTRTESARGFLKDGGLVLVIAEERGSGSDLSVLEMGSRGEAVGRSAVTAY